MSVKKKLVRTGRRKVTEVMLPVFIEMDYCQSYLGLSNHLFMITRPISFYFLFWVVEHMSKSNTVTLTGAEDEKFIEAYMKEGKRHIGAEAIKVAKRELIEGGILKRLSRGFFVVNPYLFWKDTVEKRSEFIKNLELNVFYEDQNKRRAGD